MILQLEEDSALGKPGMITMFIGAVFIAILILVDIQLSFAAWATLFIISMIIAATGAVMSIMELFKKIKEEKALKNK